MTRNRFSALALMSLMCCGLVAAGNSWAQSVDAARTMQRQWGQDQFVLGGSASVSGEVAGDLFAAGGSLEVEAPVSGDAVITGGKVLIDADVGQSVYAAGGQLRLEGKVGRNVRVAGGQVDIGRRAVISGNLSAVGGQVSVKGEVKGYVQVAGGRVYIDGIVAGDVNATSGRVELGPNARIGGKLRYRSNNELTQDAAAQVAGGVEKLALPMVRSSPSTADARPGGDRERSRFSTGLGLLWTVGLMLLAAALLALAPGFYERLSDTLSKRTGASVLLGFVLLVCLPVAAVVLLVTIIGIPLALVILALYLLLLPLGYVSAAIGFSGWALQRYTVDKAQRLAWRIGAAAGLLLLLALLAWVPWLGRALGFVVMLAGWGALFLQLQRGLQQRG